MVTEKPHVSCLMKLIISDDMSLSPVTVKTLQNGCKGHLESGFKVQKHEFGHGSCNRLHKRQDRIAPFWSKVCREVQNLKSTMVLDHYVLFLKL